MGSSKRGPQRSPDPFEALYPNLAAWVQDGWVEIGRDDVSRSFVRALDIGGLVWEGKTRYASLHDALLALDAGIATWLEEQRLARISRSKIEVTLAVIESPE